MNRRLFIKFIPLVAGVAKIVTDADDDTLCVDEKVWNGGIAGFHPSSNVRIRMDWYGNIYTVKPFTLTKI